MTRSPAPARRRATQVRYAIENAGCTVVAIHFWLALARAGNGMTKCDITHNINFFMNVPVTEQGGLSFETA